MVLFVRVICLLIVFINIFIKYVPTQFFSSKRNSLENNVKLSLFTEDMMLYIEGHEITTRKLLELISEFSKVAGYKVNTHKSPYSYTLIRKKQKENLRKQSHLPLYQKRIKYL